MALKIKNKLFERGIFLLKKFFSLILTLGIAFGSVENLKCFAQDNSTVCVVWNEYLNFPKKYNEEDYNNWNKYFRQEGKCYENLALEKRLSELEEKINRNNIINFQLSLIVVFFVGLILSNPFWKILNAASMKIDLWSEGVFNDWYLSKRVNRIESSCDNFDERVTSLEKIILNQEQTISST